ncbi:MAG: hypothetical protein ACE5DI_01120 [Candidatus Micrarchaeia archaeon]
MECEIICDGKKAATINYGENSCNITLTEEGKKLCKDFRKNGCC